MALATEIAEQGLPIAPNCAARTVKADIAPIVDVAQATGLKMEVGAFIGCSPIRQYAEGWGLEMLLRTTEEAVTFAAQEGLDVMYVTEDTTRSRPETLKALYTTAIGLSIAIPLVMALNAVNNRIRHMEELVGSGVTRFLEAFRIGLSKRKA